MEHETERTHSNNLLTDLGLFYEGGEFHAKPLLLNLNKHKIKNKLTTEPGKAAVSEWENEDAGLDTAGSTFNHSHRFTGGQIWESVFAYYFSTEDKNKIKTADKETKPGSSLFKPNKTTLEVENKEDQTWNFASSLRVPFTLGLRQELKFGGAFRARDRFREKEAQETNSKGVTKDVTKPKDDYSLTENYYAGFVQDTVWLHDRLSLLPGLRVERVDLDSASGDGSRMEKSVTDLNPSVHLLYQARNDLSLRFAFSKTVNRPKFDELSPFEQDDGNRIVIGNPDLNPSRSLNFDFGGEYATENLFFGLNLFHKDITGVIEEVDTGADQNGKDVYQTQNVGNGWTQGIELEQRFKLALFGIPALRDVQIWANQTFLESKVREDDGSARPFKQQPGMIANTGIDYFYAPWGTTFTAALNYIAGRPEYKPNGDITRIDPALTLDLSARQRLYQGLSLFGEIENVTDEDKVDFENLVNGVTSRKVETYGRTFMVGLTLQY